jgi:hypothetical protein
MLTAPGFSGRPRPRGAKRTISVAVARAWMSPTRLWLAVNRRHESAAIEVQFINRAHLQATRAIGARLLSIPRTVVDMLPAIASTLTQQQPSHPPRRGAALAHGRLCDRETTDLEFDRVAMRPTKVPRTGPSAHHRCRLDCRVSDVIIGH